jgi:DNA adenine methylase
MATYGQVKDNVGPLLLALKTIEKGRRNYLRLRALDPLTLTPSMRAARFIYLNRFCFNGLYRTNRKGQYNVPYGGDRSGRIPSNDLLLRCSSSLKGAELSVGSFEVTLEMVKSGDFVYMDPPFRKQGSRSGCLRRSGRGRCESWNISIWQRVWRT